MQFRHMAAVLMAAILPVSLLSGCRLFEMDPHEQLEKILTETGDQIVGMNVTERLEESETVVRVFWVRDNQVLSTAVLDGQLVTEDAHYVFASAGPVSAGSFSLDALVEEARAVANKDNCPIASVESMVEPTGVLGTRVECNRGDRFEQLHERSRLDGEPFYFSSLDFQSAADVDAFKESYKSVLGVSEVGELLYSIDFSTVGAQGPVMTDAVGNPCTPLVHADRDTPSTVFPVTCDSRGSVPEDSLFSLDDYDSADIAAVFSGLLNDPELNRSAIFSVTFRIWNGALFWDVGTTDIGDMMKYPGKMSGYVQKKSA